jgi:hypothetical protein
LITVPPIPSEPINAMPDNRQERCEFTNSISAFERAESAMHKLIVSSERFRQAVSDFGNQSASINVLKSMR